MPKSKSCHCGITISITIYHRPYPIYVIRNFGINSKLITFTATISETCYSEYRPRLIRYRCVTEKQTDGDIFVKLKNLSILQFNSGNIPTEERSARVTSTRIDSSTFMSSTKHILRYRIIEVHLLAIFVGDDWYL